MYLDDIDSYNKLKSIALSQTNNHPSTIRIFEKYDVFMHIHNRDNSAALNQYEKCKKVSHYQNTINSNEEIYLNTYIAAIGEDLDDFREKLKLMMSTFKTDIQNGNFTPEGLLERFFIFQRSQSIQKIAGRISLIQTHSPTHLLTSG